MRNMLSKRYLILSLVFVFPLVVGFTTIHKIYVSVTQVAYSKEERSLQLISRVFVNDLEHLLRARYEDDLVLDPFKEQSKVDFYIKKYFETKLQVTVDGKQREIQLLGKKYEDNLLIFYLEIEKIKDPTVFEIENGLLFDLFEEQQNIVHVKKNGVRKSLILERENPKGMLKFSK